MLTRAFGAATTVVMSAATLVLFASPATAYDLATPSPFLILKPDTNAAASCDFVASGPSLSPSSNPYHFVGTAVVQSRKVVVSTSLRCRLRLRDVPGRPQVGQTLAQAASGSVTALAGDIVVSQSGALEVCTWFDAVFADTTTLNPEGTEECRTLTNAFRLADVYTLEKLKDILGDLISPPPDLSVLEPAGP